ncbi:MAG: GNAT family N-acetyltransferase [Nitrospiria bacterium]
MYIVKSLEIRRVAYSHFEDVIHAIRHEVFIKEQHVPKKLEFDKNDRIATHILGFIEKRPVATGRIAPDGKIGRMAVLKEFRNQGIGGKILESLIEIGKEKGMKEFYLSAQSHAIPFYERYGFTVEGQTYKEAGIDHKLMKRKT